ncbi:MAG: DUF2865 domain-containing protein [Alphaproteobacteria bacterium]|nr:DUF2865 domain-containing protein [Alphaproteobacteria bacterium]
MNKPLRGLGTATLVASVLAGFAATATAQVFPPQPPAPIPGGAPQAAPAPAPPTPSSPPAGQPAPPPPGAANTAPSSNPVCVRLEAQLTSLDRTAGNQAHADQVKRAEDAVAQQQAELDRGQAQAHRAGCEGQGFFALFSGLSPQCSPLNSKIEQMRGNLDQAMSNLEQLKSGNSDQDGQRRAIIGLLAQNSCGSQYAAAAASTSGPRGFFDALFGGGTIVNPGGDGAPSGTYRTVCVRTCDGYYFPISYSTVPNRFTDDQRACQRLCPASTDATLYTYRNPGEDMEQAVSISGQQYTTLPNAFRYRKEVVAGCSCRARGQSWAEALKNADDATTLESGDIVVTDEKAKQLSQAPQPAPVKPGKPGTPGAPQPIADAGPANAGKPAAAAPAAQGANPAPAAPANGAPTPPESAAPAATPAAPANYSAGTANTDASGKHAVRTVGPPFLSGQ